MQSFVDFSKTQDGVLVGKGVTIGLYAHISKGVVLCSGVGIGCLPISENQPTIIHQNCFIGPGSQVHNVIIGAGAILHGAVYVDNLSPIIDLTKENHPTCHGKIPSRAIVMMAVHPKGFLSPHIFAYRDQGEGVENALKKLLGKP
jgi:tetrahydrodipicolinate N-succinyltransferase